jgi:pimeloyl-ACP methyl ester carboxylesterase
MEKTLEVIRRGQTTAQHPAPILFVHGAWHGAWCWDEHFLDYFAQQGYAVIAPSLRKHGGSYGSMRPRGARISQYVSDVAEVAAQFPTPPVLVGHSMGGLVVQRYLERHPAKGAVLMASCPPSGVAGLTLRYAVRHPIPFVSANLQTRLYPIVGTPQLARDALFPVGMPQGQVDRYFKQIQDESYLAYLDMMMFGLPRRGRIRRSQVPMLVLGAAQDHIFTPGEVRATARAYRAPVEIFPDMAHDMMLDPRWQTVADSILAWLGKQGI